MGPIYSGGGDDMMYISSDDAGDDNNSDDNDSDDLKRLHATASHILHRLTIAIITIHTINIIIIHHHHQ